MTVELEQLLEILEENPDNVKQLTDGYKKLNSDERLILQEKYIKAAQEAIILDFGVTPRQELLDGMAVRMRAEFDKLIKQLKELI